jgi:hypothetical protein
MSDVCIFAAEPVAYSFKDDSGKLVEGVSPKICVGEYVKGACISLSVVKATAEFASSCSDRIGEIMPDTAIAYDRFKRAAFLVKAENK